MTRSMITTLEFLAGNLTPLPEATNYDEIKLALDRAEKLLKANESRRVRTNQKEKF